MSFLVFLAFMIMVVAITALFMASLVHAPTIFRLVRKGYDGRPRLFGGS